MHPAVPGGGGVRAAAASAETVTALAAALAQTPQFRGISARVTELKLPGSKKEKLKLPLQVNHSGKEGRPLRDLTQLLVMVADWS
eukprot:1071951-Prorocentrum_minimum.AAC.1